MRKLLVAAALAPLCFVLTAAGPAPAGDDDILVTLANKATEIYAGKGYSPTGWSNAGSLAQGGAKTFSVTLKGGEDFSIVGMCDTSCGDLNLVLKDASGKEAASDLADDDFPIVGTKSAGTYTATVTMVKCTGTCRYSLVAYKK